MGLYDETVKVGRRTMVLFFIIDTSGSMRGAKIGQVNTAIEGILPKIKEISKENADAEIKVCVLNFATKAKWVTAAPVSVEDEAYRWEYVEAGGTTALGDACRELNKALSTTTFMKEVSGSYAPVLFLMSDGEPTDDYRSGIEVLKRNNWFKAAIKVAIGIGNDANKGMLAEFTGSDESVIEVHTPEELKKLQEDSNVENVAAMQFSLYPLDEQNRPVGIALDRAMQPGETFQVVGLNKLYLKEFFGDRLSEADLSAIENGTGCIVRNPIAVSVGEGDSLPSTRYTVGSAITVAGKALTVLETMDDYDGYLSVGNSGFTNGVQVIVIDQLYPVLTGRDTYAELLPLLTEGADRKAFDQVLEKFCQEIPGTMSVSYEQTDQQLEESFAQIHLLAWGLILFVGLIGVLNIINTVYTNIHTRKKEIGTQRAIGMSLKSLYKTFLWEGAYYGLLAAVIGGMAGSFCAMVIQGAQTGTVTLGTPPWLPLLEAAGVSVAVCLLATGIPLRQIARLSIVDAIETVE